MELMGPGGEGPSRSPPPGFSSHASDYAKGVKLFLQTGLLYIPIYFVATFIDFNEKVIKLLSYTKVFTAVCIRTSRLFVSLYWSYG